MKTILTPAMAMLLTAAALAQTPGEPFLGFDDFARRYREAAGDARPALASAFFEWQRSRAGFPIVEADGAVFVYLGKGTEQSVTLIGDFHTRSFNSVYWNEKGEPLSRIVPEAPLYFLRRQIERDARLDYQFVIDGRYTVDPLNSRSIVSGAAPSSGGKGERASEIVMPGYRLSGAAIARDAVPKGRLVVVDEAWASPKVTIYLPAGYDPVRRYPVVYTADGYQWRELITLPTILDNIIADQRVEPIIAVMIDSAPDRADWYQFNPGYLEYLAKIVDYVDRSYATRARPDARLHAGSSAGARAGLQVGLERPALISNLALLSPSLTAPPNVYEPYFTGKKRPDHRLKVWLSAGSYEGYIKADTRLMERYLRKTGVTVAATYTHEGHSFGATRNLVPDMLAYFFPARTTDSRTGTRP